MGGDVPRSGITLKERANDCGVLGQLGAAFGWPSNELY